MLEVGRVCVKTAGRDAMRHCAIVEVLDKNYVLIDGNTRRKKVNITHLEPLNSKVDVKKGADTKTVQAALEKAGFKVTRHAEAKKRKEQKPQVTKEQRKTEEKKKTSAKNSKKK